MKKFVVIFGTVLGALVSQGCNGVESEYTVTPVDFMKIELDQFTLGYHAAAMDTNFEVKLTEEGEKYYKENSPETRFQTYSGGVYVRPEFEPNMWDIYYCIDKYIESTDGIPETPALITMRTDPNNPLNNIHYLYIPDREHQRMCNKSVVNYDIDKGFMVKTSMGIGTIVIYYR